MGHSGAVTIVTGHLGETVLVLVHSVYSHITLDGLSQYAQTHTHTLNTLTERERKRDRKLVLSPYPSVSLPSSRGSTCAPIYLPVLLSHSCCFFPCNTQTLPCPTSILRDIRLLAFNPSSFSLLPDLPGSCLLSVPCIAMAPTYLAGL